MADIKTIFSEEDEQAIVEAVKQAELNTSGEIRVHLENNCKKEVLARAASVFSKLKMHETIARNGVLIYLAVKDHKFAIIGDKGIDEVVPENFWGSTKDIMQQHFRNGEFKTGLVKGITEAGRQLKSHFPYQSDDVNELPDEISKGE